MQNFKPLAIYCGSTARFVWDLVGNPEDRFSHNEAHIQDGIQDESGVAKTIADQHVIVYGSFLGIFFLCKIDFELLDICIFLPWIGL